jgi:hypothetical protein
MVLQQSPNVYFLEDNDNFNTSEPVQSYWNKLHTIEPSDHAKVLSFGPLLHRGNIPSDETKDLFVRDC